MNALISRNGLFDDWFGDFTPGFAIRPLHGSPLPSPDKIRLEISESDKAYAVTAEIPGVKKEDINVTVEGNLVTLQAEVKQQDTRKKDDNVVCSERYYGSISRSFQLPVEVDAEKANAHYDNGVLTLTLQKKQGANSRRLTIQ